METKHIAKSQVAEVIKLPKTSAEIEVPQGAHHYYVAQKQKGDATYIFHLRHPNTELKVTGLVEAAGESTPRLITEVIHHSGNTRAETLIRTLSQDRALPHYEGMIKIEEGAQNCESYLNHHSLLLGEEAASYTRPSLEIGANEVKCSHAATVRTITDADLFYLRSRGIMKEQAKEVLVAAFLSDVQI
jgi:Fe-S cluster assembly protein SufD